jgi:hypothetical protein
VRCELGFYIPEVRILHSHRRENLKSYMVHPLSKESNRLNAAKAQEEPYSHGWMDGWMKKMKAAQNAAMAVF